MNFFERTKRSLSSDVDSVLVRRILIALIAVALLLIVFKAGMIAERRNHYGYRAHGFGLPHVFEEPAHGTIGSIQMLALPHLTLTLRDGTAEDVLLSSSTAVQREQGPASAADLMAGENVLILGSPDSAANTMDARLIRILDAAPDGDESSSSPLQ